MRRNTFIIAVVLANIAAIGGYGLRSAQHAVAQPPGEDAELAKARQVYLKGLKKLDYSGVGDLMGSYIFSVRWLEADLEVANNKEQRIAAYAAHLKRMKDFEKEFRPGPRDMDPKEALEKSVLRVVIQPEAAYWLAREKLRKK